MNELPSRQDIKTRLHNSVIMYKNKPHFITVSEEDIGSSIHNVRAFELGVPKNKEFIVDYREEDFSASSPQLGYVQTNNGIIGYLERVTIRQFSTGLTRFNTIDRTGNLFIDDMFLTGSYTKNCILGAHPSFAECAKKIKDGTSIGEIFDRHFCIRKLGKNRTCSLLHREEEIARVIKEKGGMKLVSLVPETLVPRYNQMLKPHGVKINGYI